MDSKEVPWTRKRKHNEASSPRKKACIIERPLLVEKKRGEKKVIHVSVGNTNLPQVFIWDETEMAARALHAWLQSKPTQSFDTSLESLRERLKVDCSFLIQMENGYQFMCRVKHVPINVPMEM
jgi:hypothetical protein